MGEHRLYGEFSTGHMPTAQPGTSEVSAPQQPVMSEQQPRPPDSADEAAWKYFVENELTGSVEALINRGAYHPANCLFIKLFQEAVSAFREAKPSQAHALTGAREEALPAETTSDSSVIQNVQEQDSRFKLLTGGQGAFTRLLERLEKIGGAFLDLYNRLMASAQRYDPWKVDTALPLDAADATNLNVPLPNGVTLAFVNLAMLMSKNIVRKMRENTVGGSDGATHPDLSTGRFALAATGETATFYSQQPDHYEVIARAQGAAQIPESSPNSSEERSAFGVVSVPGIKDTDVFRLEIYGGRGVTGVTLWREMEQGKPVARATMVPDQKLTRGYQLLGRLNPDQLPPHLRNYASPRTALPRKDPLQI